MSAADVGLHPNRPRNGLSLCAGYGGLDLGLQLAEPDFHTVCFVEQDPVAQAAIVAGMVGGHLPRLAKYGPEIEAAGSASAARWRARPFRPAPVWGNLRTFVGDHWRGRVDAILAGYPCQPFSAAGQRRGEDDERHLWPDIERIVGEIEPEWLIFENVAGHVSLGLETVLRRLWRMGYTPAAGLFSAGETGAPHQRLRVFIVAHRGTGLGHAPGIGRREGVAQPSLFEWWDATPGPGGAMADAGGKGRRQDARGPHGHEGAHEGRRPEHDHQPSGDGQSHRAAMDDAAGSRHQPEGRGSGPQRQGGQPMPRAGRAAMGDTHPAERWARHARGHELDGHDARRAQADRRSGEPGEGPAVADTGQPGPQGREQRGPFDGGHWPQAHGSTAQRGRPWLHAPGPAEAERWADILGAAPHLAPATSLSDCLAWAGQLAQALEGPQGAALESRLRGMADGLAGRSRALRGLGNGVHPLAAGHAWRTLAAAHGLRPLDLDASMNP